MIKKILLAVLSFLFLTSCVFAKDIPVKLVPVVKVSTSNLLLQEGDEVEFFIAEDVPLKRRKLLRNQVVTGVITIIRDNNYYSEPAEVCIENLRLKSDSRVSLSGVIYKKGNEHAKFGDFFKIPIVRGGEVQIKPEKDVFTVYIEENL